MPENNELSTINLPFANMAFSILSCMLACYAPFRFTNCVIWLLIIFVIVAFDPFDQVPPESAVMAVASKENSDTNMLFYLLIFFREI